MEEIRTWKAFLISKIKKDKAVKWCHTQSLNYKCFQSFEPRTDLHWRFGPGVELKERKH